METVKQESKPINWTNIIIACILLFSLISCDIQKNKKSEDKETDYKSDYEKIVVRQGDSVIHKTNVHFKDTTIYTINRQGTTLRTVYDKQGQVSQTECFASAINELIRFNEQFKEKEQVVQKETSHEANFDWLIYIVGGIVIVMIFAIFMLFTKLNSVIKVLNEKA